MNMIVLAVILASSIFSPTSANPVEKNARVHDVNVELAVSSALNEFGWNLYQELRNTSSNFVFSPLSVDFEAFLLWVLTAGESRKQLANALRLSDKYDVNTWVDGIDGLLSDLAMEGQNSTWGHVDRVVGDANLTAAVVNDFVANGTNYRIQNFVEYFNKSDLIMAMSAENFDGYWKSPFDPSETHSAPFQTSTGDNVMVQMMQQKGNFPLYSDGVIQVLKLNYQDGFSMILLLPTAMDGLNAIEDALPSLKWEEFDQALEVMDVAVTLPKFSFESMLELNGPLQGLGIHNIFTPGGDWLFYIRRFLHRAVVNVTETGTGAAAASGYVQSFPHGRSGDSASFTANHPFIFVIRDDTFKTNFLVGRFEEP